MDTKMAVSQPEVQCGSVKTKNLPVNGPAEPFSKILQHISGYAHLL